MKAEGGFTLIETLVATMILAIGIVTILQLFSGGLRSVTASGKYTKAIFHAREKMNEILIADSLSEGTVEGTFDDGYRWRADILKIEEESKKVIVPITRFSIHLIVEWLQGIRTKQVEMTSVCIAREIKEGGGCKAEETFGLPVLCTIHRQGLP